MSAERYPWRATWAADDPRRVCYTCGSPPVLTFRDGSPKYDCPSGPHTPIYSTGAPQARYSITLNAEQRALATDCADFMAGRGEGRTDRWGAPSYANTLVGSAGELAFALLAGLPFTCNPQGFSRPDVGRYQVRTSRRDPYLVVRENDADATPVVAILGREDTWGFRLVGWVPMAGPCKQARLWRDPGGRRPAWFVPYEELEPPATIPELMSKGGA